MELSHDLYLGRGQILPIESRETQRRRRRTVVGRKDFELEDYDENEVVVHELGKIRVDSKFAEIRANSIQSFNEYFGL